MEGKVQNIMADGDSCEKPVRPMSGSEFRRLSEFIRDQCGIKMPPVKKIMLEARLQKRLRSLGIASFKEYYDYLFNDGTSELVHMIDAVTTNKTDFFREPMHFKYLTEILLPEFVGMAGRAIDRKFMVWSAGCSTGEEPYTLAMVLSEFGSLSPGFRFSVLATDIASKVLEKAKIGIYEQERTTAIPRHCKLKYLMRSKDKSRNLVRIVPEVRSLIRFQRVNLVDEYPVLQEPADAIFCRNVIIYFERENQERLLSRLCRSLRTGGHLFLGHSETVHGFELPLVRVTSTIYRKVV
jgi:chemotaxis protein methyltransferase CheR